MRTPNDEVVCATCPLCAARHTYIADKTDLDWYFVCCGFSHRLVWRRDEAGRVQLESVPDDPELNP